MNKHSYLSTRLVDLNNINMYTVDKQYKNRRHIGLNYSSGEYERVYLPRVHTILTRTCSERVANPGFRRGRSNKERQRLQPLTSVARAPLFEVRWVRFTHSLYWYTSVTRAWVILFNRCYFNVLFFDLKHNVRDTDVDLSAFKHFSGLK